MRKIGLDYIMPSISGRLGNNMFMIANAFSKSLEYNKQLIICKHHIRNEYMRMFRKLDMVDFYIDKDCVYNPSIPSDDKHSLYVGYFQSEDYFKKYSSAIKFLFSPPHDVVIKLTSDFPFLHTDEVMAIHIRRGDYLNLSLYHPTSSSEYVYKVINSLPIVKYCMIFSDDIKWCKENIHPKFQHVYYIDYKEDESIWLMSMCHYFIISNSSFSWWGAYLADYNKKLVIAPSVWYGPNGPNDWNEIYCKDWIKFPSYFENGLIMPKL